MNINDIQQKTAFMLEDIDINVQDILDYIGHKKSSYNLLYVALDRFKADYSIVLGCTNNIAWLYENLDLIFVKEPNLIITDKVNGFYNGSFNCMDYSFNFKSCSRLRILNKFRSYLKRHKIKYHSINVIHKGNTKNMTNKRQDKYKYNPRCIYCRKQNTIILNEPINYQCCTFRCRNCKYNNIKEIIIK